MVRPAARRGAMAFGALRSDALIIIEAADDEIEAVAGVIIAQLLRILILLRWVLRLGDDRQAGEVAIVFGLPVPIAPRGHRGQRARPDIPFDAQRRSADLVARIQSGIQVGATVTGMVARKGIALRRGNRKR